MNQNSKFSQKFQELALQHPIAKWIYTYYDTNNQADLIDIIERLFDLYHKEEKELLLVKEEGLKFHIPKIKLKFSESPEEIKRQMITTMFDIIYEFENDGPGGWFPVTEVEYIQNHTKRYGARIIYTLKK